jgi:hypothetical protein
VISCDRRSARESEERPLERPGPRGLASLRGLEPDQGLSERPGSDQIRSTQPSRCDRRALQVCRKADDRNDMWGASLAWSPAPPWRSRVPRRTRAAHCCSPALAPPRRERVGVRRVGCEKPCSPRFAEVGGVDSVRLVARQASPRKRVRPPASRHPIAAARRWLGAARRSPELRWTTHTSPADGRCAPPPSGGRGSSLVRTGHKLSQVVAPLAEANAGSS